MLCGYRLPTRNPLLGRADLVYWCGFGACLTPRNRGATTQARRKGAAVIITTLKVPKTGGLPTTKVNVVRWFKQEGDMVKRGDAVVELETEKVNYELDSPTEGVLLKILAKEGDAVPVGDPVCQIGLPGDAPARR